MSNPFMKGYCPECGKDTDFLMYYGSYLCCKCKKAFDEIDFAAQREQEAKGREMFEGG